MMHRITPVIILGIVAHAAAAQTLKFSSTATQFPLVFSNFGLQGAVIKVDNGSGSSPVTFDVAPATGRSGAGNWISVTLVNSASAPCSTNVKSATAIQFPKHLTATTPAYLCVQDTETAQKGYYPAFLNFSTGGKLAAVLQAELRIFPSGYLQLGDFTGDGGLEGKTLTFLNVQGTAPPPQTVYAAVEDNGNGFAQHDGTRITNTRYDLAGNPADWITVQAFDSRFGTPIQNGSSPTTYKISIDPTRVPAGVTDLSGVVQFNSTFDNTQPVNNSYPGESFVLISASIIPPRPALSPASSSVSLAYPYGPLQQTIVLGTNGPSIPFTAVASSADGTGWLQVSPSSGTAPVTLTLTANVNASRAPGSYTGSVQITPTNPLTPAANINVGLTVTKPAPTLVFTPSSINLTCSAGTRAPDQSIAVTSSDGSRVNFSYGLDSVAGVTVDGSTGSTAGNVTLHGNCQNVSSGVYRGNLTFAQIPPNPNVPSQSVPIALTVTAALTLTASTPSLQFNFVQQGGLPAAQPITLFLSNATTTAVTLKSTTTSGQNWLFAPATGSTNQPISILVNPAGLQPGTFSGQIVITCPAATNQITIAVQLTVTTSRLPVISSVSNSATGLQEVAPGAFFSVYGANLGLSALTWENAIVNDLLPTELQSVQVKINNQNAYIYFANETQINAVVPALTGTGTVQVQVLTKDGVTSGSVLLKPYSPAIFPLFVANKAYATAVIYGESATTLALPAGASAGYRTRPARPGDILLVYATGLGPTNPQYPDGKVLRQAYPVPDLSKLKVAIGGIAVNPQFAGLVSPGLFQINLVVPADVPDGDQPITVEIGSEKSPATTYLAVQR